jgi:hypothetical protein
MGLKPSPSLELKYLGKGVSLGGLQLLDIQQILFARKKVKRRMKLKWIFNACNGGQVVFLSSETAAFPKFTPLLSRLS